MGSMACSREVAEARVIRALEERWSDDLPEGEIPEGIRRRLRGSLRFQRWVETVMRGQGLRFSDLDVTLRVTRARDGRPVDLMELELGDDPRRWYCPECREEQEKPVRGPCAACLKYLRTGIGRLRRGDGM